MKKASKRLLSVLLVIVLAISCANLLTFSAFAEGGYTVTLYADDGYGTEKKVQTDENGLFVFPECDFTPPPEMTFEAWAVGSKLGDRYVPGQAISLTEDTLIVAVWTESAAMYEKRPTGGITGVNEGFEITYSLKIQPDTVFLEFYNDYQKAWAERFCTATIPEAPYSLTKFTVPCLHSNTEETVTYRLRACEGGIDYFSNEFAIKYTANRFTQEPEDALLTPGEAYEASYAMSFTPTAVTVEHKNGDAWEHYQNASETGTTISGGDGESTQLYRIKAVCDGDTYYSREFKITWAQTTEVSTMEQLVNAVNSDRIYIKLKNAIEDSVPADELPTKHRLIFNGGMEYILDLNGFDLTVRNRTNEYFTGEFSLVEVSNGSSLKILNGSISFENYYAKANRQSRGVVAVEDTSTLTANRVDMRNLYTGTVVYGGSDAKITLASGEYSVQNGFAIYLENQASLTLDETYIHTLMGDGASTQYVDGYGALYSESSGELVINYALFKSGVQVSPSQIGAFSTATHEVTINGKKLTEDIFSGSSYEAKEQNKEYYWYYFTGCALYKTENSLFANPITVISYEKKYPISVESGTAMIGGKPVTEASYGQVVTIVADAPEDTKAFVRWGTSGVSLDDHYSATTTFSMPPAPVALAAYYGQKPVNSVSISIGEITAGQKVYGNEITADGGVVIGGVEWREDSVIMGDYDIFKAGKTYAIKLLVYPPENYNFDGTLTATVNGKGATVSSNSQYAYVDYTFETTESVGFSVIFDMSTTQLGVGGKIVIDTAAMAAQSAEFKAALDAGELTYRWYRNDEAIEGANDSVYNLEAEDAGGRFFVIVSANGKTNYSHNLNCGSDLFKVYLNSSEIVAGGKAPQMSVATPGVSIDAESLYLYEILGENSYGAALNIKDATLIPGKSYRLVGKLIEQDGTDVAYGASVYVGGTLMADTVDDTFRFFYDFKVPEADYNVYYKTNGAIGIGVSATVDIEKMAAESGTFKHALETANSTYTTVFYQWYRNGEAIKGATGTSYTVKAADKNSYIHCVVTLVDGKFGVGEQMIITTEVTVFNVEMPYPKNGETRIEGGIYVDGVGQIQIMWWPKETGAVMQGDETYVEGTVYEYHILFSAKDGFVFADAEDRTVYVYGEKITHASGYAYTGEVTAIHAHQYSDAIWDHDEDSHWQVCIVPNCPNPSEEWKTYTDHKGGTATCQEKGACAICGAEYLAGHDFSVPDYQYVDEMKCANFCEHCDVWADWSYHEGGVSDCLNKAICEICHHEYGETADHADTNGDGKCDSCLKDMATTPDTPTDPDTPDTPDNPNDTPDNDGGKKKLGTGAIIGIVIGSAAGACAVGVGIFSLVWFVIKKKSLADLIAIFKKSR